MATVAKPGLVGAQREQQVRDAVAGRQPGLGDLHAPAEHPPPAGRHEQGAGLADQPDAERAALAAQPGPRVQLARVVADEVAEQAERDPLGRGVGRAACGRTTLAPRRA